MRKSTGTPENDETFELSAEDEAKLVAATEEAALGKFVDGAAVLLRLREGR